MNQDEGEMLGWGGLICYIRYKDDHNAANMQKMR